MKIIITESQNLDLIVRRRMQDIIKKFKTKMTAYPPCDYNYEDGVYDYYSDIKNTVVDSMISELGLSWETDNIKINELDNSISELFFPIMFPALSSFFNDIIEAGCEDY